MAPKRTGRRGGAGPSGVGRGAGQPNPGQVGQEQGNPAPQQQPDNDPPQDNPQQEEHNPEGPHPENSLPSHFTDEEPEPDQSASEQSEPSIQGQNQAPPAANLAPEMMAAFAAFLNHWQGQQPAPPPPPPPQPVPARTASSYHQSRGTEARRTNPRRNQEEPQEARFTLAQVEELIEQKMRRIDPSIVPKTTTRASHPFTERLFSIIIPEHITLHQLTVLKPYDGETDPSRHVDQFTSALMGRGAIPDHFALLFPATLSGSASTWFYNLPRASIDSWDQLRVKFEDAHIGRRTLLQNRKVLKTQPTHARRRANRT